MRKTKPEGRQSIYGVRMVTHSITMPQAFWEWVRSQGTSYSEWVRAQVEAKAPKSVTRSKHTS